MGKDGAWFLFLFNFLFVVLWFVNKASQRDFLVKIYVEFRKKSFRYLVKIVNSKKI